MDIKSPDTPNKLAVYGGPKVRNQPLPFRKLFGPKELKAIVRVFKDSWQNKKDFGYQGKFEALYTDQFCDFQGGGFADAVSSGTAAVYVALAALELEPACEVIVSTITDPGSISPIIALGLKPVVADSQPKSFNIGPAEFKNAISSNTKAAVLTHSGGHPIDIRPIIEIAQAKGIKIIEDCSQAHGALYKGDRVGCFGDIAVFSTMFSKNHATGGCGGIVFSKSRDYLALCRALADRGKPFHQDDFDPKNPAAFLFPALNFNLDELSCAIGSSTLSRLPEIISRRYEIAQKINANLLKSEVVFPYPFQDDCLPSLFFLTVQVKIEKLKASKIEFAEAVAAEGIGINPHYKYLASEWTWLHKHLARKTETPNAKNIRDRSFNILFNECFSESDIEDIINSILKVEKYFLKGKYNDDRRF